MGGVKFKIRVLWDCSNGGHTRWYDQRDRTFWNDPDGVRYPMTCEEAIKVAGELSINKGYFVQIVMV